MKAELFIFVFEKERQKISSKNFDECSSNKLTTIIRRTDKNLMDSSMKKIVEIIYKQSLINNTS